MKSPYDRYWHKVSLMSDTPLSAMLKATTLQVNSYHHQGIRDLSFQLCPMAYSPDGLVEAFYHSSKNSRGEYSGIPSSYGRKTMRSE